MILEHTERFAPRAHDIACGRALSSALCLLLLIAACGGARKEQRAPPPPQQQAPPQAEAAPDQGVTVEYRPSAEGKTLLEVASPEGAQIQVYDGAQLVNSDTAPLSFNAAADHYYRFLAHLPGGALREKKVQARDGQIGTLRFIDSGPTGPQPMTGRDFHTLLRALDLEGSDIGKLSILRTAVANAYFSTAQAGALIEHVVYRQDKLDAVPLLRDRILDKQNEYLLYQHFTYREDKEKVRLMLEK